MGETLSGPGGVAASAALLGFAGRSTKLPKASRRAINPFTIDPGRNLVFITPYQMESAFIIADSI